MGLTSSMTWKSQAAVIAVAATIAISGGMVMAQHKNQPPPVPSIAHTTNLAETYLRSEFPHQEGYTWGTNCYHHEWCHAAVLIPKHLGGGVYLPHLKCNTKECDLYVDPEDIPDN